MPEPESNQLFLTVRPSVTRPGQRKALPGFCCFPPSPAPEEETGPGEPPTRHLRRLLHSPGVRPSAASLPGP